MNIWQITQDIIWRLNPQNFLWGEAPLEPVLSRIVAAPAPAGYFRHDAIVPYGLLQLESARHNEEHPADLIEEARWSLYLIAANASEQAGAGAVVGGNRASLGSSRGRGLVEIEPLVMQKIFNAVGLSARPRVSGSRPPSIPDELAGLVTMRALEISATRIPALPDYGPIQRLKSPSSLSTLIAWAPLSRYDLVGYYWVRTAGANGVSSPTGGTFVESDGTATMTIKIVGTAITGYNVQFYTSTAVVAVSVAAGATPAAVATATAALMNASGSFNSRMTASASGDTITVTPNSGIVAAAIVNAGATPGQVTVRNNASLSDAAGSGLWTYTIFWAFDATRDPFSAQGVSPVAANRYSSQQSSQAGLVYIPATLTISQ